MGSLDWPFNPLSLAIGAEAAFVARAIDTDRAQLTEVLRTAAAHRGSAFVEIFQNCNIYNDGAFDFVREDKTNRIYLEQGKPIRFGEEREKGVRQRADGSVEVVDVTDESELLVHDAHHVEPSAAFALSRLTQSTANATPIGVFRDVERPVYDELMSDSWRRRVSSRRGTSRRSSAPATPGRSSRLALRRGRIRLPETDGISLGIGTGGEPAHPRHRLRIIRLPAQFASRVRRSP